MKKLEQVKSKLNDLKMIASSKHVEEIIQLSSQYNWSFLESLDSLLDIEVEAKRQNRIERLFKNSKLSERVTIDQFDFNYDKSRKNQKELIINLMDLLFIKERKDIIIIGNTGVGKTYLAKCLAYESTQSSIKTLFTTAIDMINHLIAAKADHSLVKKLQYYQRPDLLVCDEVGYLPLDNDGANLFFQVISARHEKKSTIITTNLRFADWGNIFGNTTIATAIADRLVYNSEVLVMGGQSYRKRYNKKNNKK
jgi:DNA replication protein DnaC